MVDDLGRKLVEVVEWRGDKPVRIVLTDDGRSTAARAIPLVNQLGLDLAADMVGLPARRLQILLQLHALSGDREGAEVEITDEEDLT